jgi:hypothetical protein
MRNFENEGLEQVAFIFCHYCFLAYSNSFVFDEKTSDFVF